MNALLAPIEKELVVCICPFEHDPSTAGTSMDLYSHLNIKSTVITSNHLNPIISLQRNDVLYIETAVA
ncbi:hypothetical protein Tcan_06335 [Toxocara canis]|uniref:Uncharacterized protein n=1 Tax=Toxocara canis TaxID=6265 RepID=A0A0B2V9Q4_TOXCA|nr:hypothetical protein Tcan_06335 [Toxocara canis]